MAEITPIHNFQRRFSTYLAEKKAESDLGELIGVAAVWQYENGTVVAETEGMIFDGYRMIGYTVELQDMLRSVECEYELAPDL
jgi:hypothetical protein|tara:strand:- start:1047 stop:1295 length:249 start_codon:yes stop_codon:yes gene_type:complete